MKTNRNTADLFLIVLAVVTIAVALAFFSGTIKVHASPILYTPRTLSETRGKVTVTTCDSHTLYEYHNDDYHPCSTMQPAQARTARNTPIVVTTPNVPNVPNVPAIELPATPETPQVIDDNGATLPDDTVTEEPTTEEPPVVKEDKVHCNNGEGNGAEGCSPAQSSHANNDENNTTPKEDKANKS